MPPGQAAWRFTYDGPATAGGRLSTITRDAATPGGASARQATFVYNIPVTTGASVALPFLGTADVAVWSQDAAPTTGFAMFGPDRPAVNPASVADADWHYADLSYTTDQGYEVNTAVFGAGHWLLTATDYDTQGNVTRTLDPSAIDYLTAQNAAGDTPTSEEADFHSTQTVYNPDITDGTGAVTVPAGTQVSDTYGPAAQVTLPSGTVVTARNHQHTTYNQGAPNNGVNPATGTPYGLPTTVATTVADSTTGTDVTLSTVTNDYTSIQAGDGDGWTLGVPVTVTTNGTPAVTRFDTAGRTIESREPSATTSTSPWRPAPCTTPPERTPPTRPAGPAPKRPRGPGPCAPPPRVGHRRPVRCRRRPGPPTTCGSTRPR